MLILPPDTAKLAERLAQAKGVEPLIAVRHALEDSARAAGLAPEPRRRMTADEMMALGRKIAAMPLLDPRTPQEIMDEINEV